MGSEPLRTEQQVMAMAKQIMKLFKKMMPRNAMKLKKKKHSAVKLLIEGAMVPEAKEQRCKKAKIPLLKSNFIKADEKHREAKKL
jgi:hypothetical protein